jgi:FtsH-binding integral membrane protein
MLESLRMAQVISVVIIIVFSGVIVYKRNKIKKQYDSLQQIINMLYSNRLKQLNIKVMGSL